MASSQEEFKFDEVYEFQDRFWMLAANDKAGRFAMLKSLDFAESKIFVDAQSACVYHFDDVNSTKTYAGKLGEIKVCGIEYWKALAGGDQETYERKQQVSFLEWKDGFDPDSDFDASDAIADYESFDYEFWGDALGDIL